MSGAEPRLAIVTALPEEARAIGKALGTPAVSSLAASRESLVVAWTGDGAARARRNLALLVNSIVPTRLIGAGIAGGLTDDLARGAIVRPSAALDETGRRIALSQGDRGSLIVSAARPLLSSAEKRSLANALSVEEHTVVDLETFGWAEIAASRNIPFSAVRIVLDAVADDLPGFLAAALRPDGSTNRRAVALSAALHPGQLRRLLQLRRKLQASCESLASAIKSALREPA